MHKALLSALLVISLVVAEVTCGEARMGPPERPQVFQRPEDLVNYLKALNEYYAIVGRPRFGRSVNTNKRSVEELGDLKSDE
uniref:Conotoxin unclassified superfamily n=1 Tax=Conus ebraeus TaxID=89425 RepID=A0A9Y1Z2S9_CONEA|nr:conotoxin precursor unclassified superfamily [Conus ebraeus]